MKEKKPFKVGALYELRPEYLERLWFTDPAIDYCKAVYGVERHVFRGKCVELSTTGGAYLELSSSYDTFYAMGDERHMFRRVDNK